MNIRFANEADLPGVNRLRKQVNDLHVIGKPEVFKEGFSEELRDYIYSIFDDPLKKIVVYEIDGVVRSFAVLMISFMETFPSFSINVVSLISVSYTLISFAMPFNTLAPRDCWFPSHAPMARRNVRLSISSPYLS